MTRRSHDGQDADRQQELGIVGLWRACMLEFPPLHSAENGQATLGQSLKLKQSPVLGNNLGPTCVTPMRDQGFKIWSTSSSFWQTSAVYNGSSILRWGSGGCPF